MDLAQQLQQLYSQFGHLEGISVELHKDLIAIAIENDAAEALIFLQGAQIAEYQAHGQPKTLWLSEANTFQAGKPLRGGIPICWPWFGNIEDNSPEVQRQFQLDKIAGSPHGLVRDQLWQLSDITSPDPQHTQLTFKLSIDDKQSELWPYPSELTLLVVVGRELNISFKVTNTGTKNFLYSCALHSYFSVSDIHNCQVEGLDGCDYVDKTEAFKPGRQSGSLNIRQETDRIYNSGAISTIAIQDPQQRTELISQGSASTVVWNPWQQRAKQLGQFNAEDYLTMLCVETANATDNWIELAPQQSTIMDLTLATAQQS